MEPCLIDAVNLLSELSEDSSIPKNVRSTMNEVINILNDDCELPVKCDKAIQSLTVIDELNIDVFIKTQVWSLMSLLESASKN